MLHLAQALPGCGLFIGPLQHHQAGVGLLTGFWPVTHAGNVAQVANGDVQRSHEIDIFAFIHGRNFALLAKAELYDCAHDTHPGDTRESKRSRHHFAMGWLTVAYDTGVQR